MVRKTLMAAVLMTLLLSGRALGAGPQDPVVYVAFALTIMIAAAKLAGDVASRFGQPSVLGELLAGVVLGNLALAGFTGFDPIKSDPNISLLAQLGVIILLFEVGLESTVREMLRVGPSALLVAVLGVVTPFALGWAVGVLLLPEAGTYTHAFIGATLTATSVGITARVLKDLNRSKSQEARIILGAAVIDDILGLVVLAVLTGVIAAADRGGSVSYWHMAGVLGKAVVFLAAALVLGVYLSPRLFWLAAKLRVHGVLLATALVVCFLLSYLSAVIGLAPIVGAYAAGLILEQVHWREFTDRGEHHLEELIKPISEFLAPIFFVLMGMKVDLRAFSDPSVLGLAALLILAGLIGKQACSAGVLKRGVDRLSIGIGMIPRGEVGLIFANIGLGLTLGGQRVISEQVFTALVLMVIVTTMGTPPLLKWSLNRKRTGGMETERAQKPGVR